MSINYQDKIFQAGAGVVCERLTHGLKTVEDQALSVDMIFGDEGPGSWTRQTIYITKQMIEEGEKLFDAI